MKIFQHFFVHNFKVALHPGNHPSDIRYIGFSTAWPALAPAVGSGIDRDQKPISSILPKWQDITI
jgi:hypothetical protein